MLFVVINSILTNSHDRLIGHNIDVLVPASVARVNYAGGVKGRRAQPASFRFDEWMACAAMFVSGT